MHSLITSYLLQSGACSLPGIGSLQLKRWSSTLDSTNKQILPPSEEVVCLEETNTKSEGLVKYISDRKGLELNQAEVELNNFCTDCKERLNAGETIELPTVGTLQKNKNGKYKFTPEKSHDFYEPIGVDEVYEIDEVAEINNVEEEPFVVEANDYEEQVIVEKSNWGLWAIILIAIASVVIFYNFRVNSMTGSSTGNQTKVVADSAKATYKVPR